MIKEHHLGTGCIYEPSEIIKSLELLYKNWERGTLPRLRQDKDLDIESFSREVQYSRYLDILNGFDADTEN